MKLIQALLLFIIYVIPFTFLMKVRSCPKYKKYYVLVKAINSACFIGVAVYCGVYGDNIRMLVYFLPALFFCFIGDVIIGFYNRITCTKNDKNQSSKIETSFDKTMKITFFIAGLTSFFLGHVCFIYAFTRIQKLSFVDFVFPIVAIFVTIAISRLEGMNTGKLTFLVAIYSFMIALLFSKSIHIALVRFSISNLLLSIGTSLFLISDLLILFLYFYKKKHPAVHIINLATYYYAMFFIALSLLY